MKVVQNHLTVLVAHIIGDHRMKWDTALILASMSVVFPGVEEPLVLGTCTLVSELAADHVLFFTCAR